MLQSCLKLNFRAVPREYEGKNHDGRLPQQAPDDTDARAIKKAYAKCRQDLVGRAVKGCLDTIARRIEQSAEELYQGLCKLHPFDDDDGPRHAIPPLKDPRGSRVGALGKADFVKILHTCCNGAAAGVSGWTPELYDIVCRDPLLEREVRRLVLDIINNDVTPDVRQRLDRCRLVGLGKPDGGVRPIAVGEALLKIAGKVLFATYKPEIVKHFGTLQFGCLKDGGCETIVHNVRWDVRSGMYVLTIDQSNAFNSPHRQAIARALYDVPGFACFQRMFQFEYGDHSELLFFSSGAYYNSVWSQRGTRQGSALGGFFFCVVLHPALVELERAFPTVRVYAYCDDVTLTSHNADDLVRAYFLFKRLCQPLGLRFNPAKCEWYGGLACAVIPAELLQEGVKEVKGCIKILGAFVGEPRAVSAKLVEKMEKHDCLFARFEKMKPCPASYAMLLKCTLPRHVYHMRTHPPDETAELCRRFDARIIALAVKWFNLDVNDKVGITIATLPMKIGGNGLIVTADVRAFAFEDSEHRAISALAALGRHKIAAKPPVSQRDATIAFQLKKKTELLASIGGDVRDKVEKLLEANSVKGAPGWLIAHRKWMPPQVYAAAWRFRARAVSTVEAPQLRCPACPSFQGGRLLDQVEFVEHVHGCTKIASGDNATRAHHHLVKRIVHHVEENGGHATREPREYQSYKCPKCPFETVRGLNVQQQVRAHDKKCGASLIRSGVDAELWLQRQRYLVDATIAHLVCESHFDTAIAAVVGQKIATKYHHYVEVLKIVSPEEFVVAVAHSTGGLHVHLHQLLGKIGREFDVPYPDLVEDIRHTVMWGTGASITAAFRATTRRCTSLC